MDPESSLSTLFDDPQKRSNEDIYKALRYIKNSSIGNMSRKKQYLERGICSVLGEILSSDNQPLKSKIEACVCVASLSRFPESNHIVKLNPLSHIVGFFEHVKDEQVDAVLYSISTLIRIEGICYKSLYERNTLSLLYSFIDLTDQTGKIDLYSLSIIAMRKCRFSLDILSKILLVSVNEFPVLKETDSIPLIILIFRPELQSRKVLQDAALKTFCNVLKIEDNLKFYAEKYKKEILDQLPNLLTLNKHEDPLVKFRACSCITKLCSAGIIPEEAYKKTKNNALTTILEFLNDSNYISNTCSSEPPIWDVCLTFHDLLEEDEFLQTCAMEGNSIKKVGQILFNGQEKEEENQKNSSEGIDSLPETSSKILENIIESGLLVLSVICSSKEECRKRIIDAELLPLIIKYMSHKSSRIKAAACKCARSLSRSTKKLRISLVECGIAEPLFKLLYDEDLKVQIISSATICNTILSFPQMKRPALESGALERLVDLSESPNDQLRLHVVWALKNFSYHAESSIKAAIMERLTWEKLKKLTDDPYIPVQEQTLNLLRNIASGKEEDIEKTFSTIGTDNLLGVIERKLSTGSPKAVLHSLYIIVNISTGCATYKNKIIEKNEILESIMKYTHHPDPLNRTAALWCIINSTWFDDDYTHMSRISKLREFGFEKRLFEILLEDVSSDVKDRARTALNNFGHTTINNCSATSPVPNNNKRNETLSVEESSIT